MFVVTEFVRRLGGIPVVCRYLVCLSLPILSLCSVFVVTEFVRRLGGIPVGVVAVETRTVELVVPADPANIASDSKVRHLHQFYSCKQL